MKTDLKTYKLSHIIVYADKNLPQAPFLSFCTNVRSEDSKIRLTYLCYDNQFLQDEKNILNILTENTGEETEGLFVITDSPDVLSCAVNNRIAAVALYTDVNRKSDLSKALYCIEDIEYIPLDCVVRMWQRSHGIPWTIATTDRLVIREHIPEDLDGLYDIYADKEATMYMEDLYEDREEEAEYLRQYIDSQYRFFEYGIWALTRKSDGTLIGRAGISNREGFDIPEIGYIIGKPYRGSGYAKEAVKAIMEYGSRELGFEEYMAFTRMKNRASVRLLESLGFSRRGFVEIRGGEHAMYTLTNRQ